MSLALQRLVQCVPNFSLPLALKRAGCTAAIMLSKWLFISLLALGIENISAANLIGSYIDVSKFSIFYDPSTQSALKGALENVSRDPFPGIGFHGVKCNCNGLNCGCCNGINITRFNIERHACTNLTFYPEEMAIKFRFLINEREIFNSALSAKNPAPVCFPFYPPFISFCVRVFDVYIVDQNLHACVDFETIVVAWPILILHFDCIKVGTNGIFWMKPEVMNFNDSNLPQLSEVNGPEIYDQVNFEPDPAAPNNNTSNISPEEANIGQLKL